MSSKQVPDHDGGVVGKAISPQIQDALVNFCMEYVFSHLKIVQVSIQSIFDHLIE